MPRIVLVADDSPTIQKRALGILTGEGFEVETVANGVAAIKRLAVLHPVLILADVSMPGRDGYEVCDFVKKSPELSHVPVLLVASDMEPYDHGKGARVRADGIIKKPFEARELIALVTKFAPKFDEVRINLPQPVASTQPRERTQEFAALTEVPEDVPDGRPPVKPDLSMQPESVAFQFSAEDTQAFPHETFQNNSGMPIFEPPADATVLPLSAFDPAKSVFDEFPLAAASAPSRSEIPTPASPVGDPSFVEAAEAPAIEPVFIEEPLLPSEHDNEIGAHTLIFRSPVAIADPVWQDETIPPHPAHPAAGRATAKQPASAELATAFAETPAEQRTDFDTESASADASPGTVYAESVPYDDITDAGTAGTGYAEPAPEALQTTAGAAEDDPSGVAANQVPKSDPSMPVFDWNLFYAVVHKTVVRMSPPVLPAEVVESIARQIADEIAIEISSGLPPT